MFGQCPERSRVRRRHMCTSKKINFASWEYYFKGEINNTSSSLTPLKCSYTKAMFFRISQWAAQWQQVQSRAYLLKDSTGGFMCLVLFTKTDDTDITGRSLVCFRPLDKDAENQAMPFFRSRFLPWRWRNKDSGSTPQVGLRAKDWEWRQKQTQIRRNENL